MKEVFEFVAEGASRLGVVPVENSSAGTIKDTVDCLVEAAYRDLFIQESLTLKVRLALFGKSAKGVRTIYSHFAPLHHCQGWLNHHYPNAEIKAVASTPKAVEIASKERGAAAIGNLEAGEIYGLKVLEFPIAPEVENVTQFFVIGHREGVKAKDGRTSLIVTLPNRPGALVDFLLPFRDAGLNLSRIISRSIAGSPARYSFLTDIDGSMSDAKVRRALKGAGKVAENIQSLGTYPVRKRYVS